jgi:ABC-type multidrug transport system ATPase subunit
MIVKGRITATGTAEEMASRSRRGVRIRFRLSGEAWALAPGALRAPASRVGDVVEVSGVDEVAYLRKAISWSETVGHRLHDLEVHRPSLSDVYLELVG